MDSAKLACSISLVLLASGVAGPAWSQSPASSAEAATNDQGLAEIIVTANKREQTLNDVGMTVSVISSEQLKTRQINTLADIANAVPGLTFTNSAENTPVYTIRGVGFYDDSLGGYPAVSINVDEIPLPFPALAAHAAYDLERIEVLKGPQGTLYGENATGGAINLIEAKPTKTFSAGGDLSYGRFNNVDMDAFVSGPITDVITARLVGRVERADAWQVSDSRPEDHNGRVNNFMGRLLVDFDPSDSVRIRFSVNGWEDHSQTQAAQYNAFQPATPGRTPALLQYEYAFAPEDPRAADWNVGIPFADNSMWQTALRGEFDLIGSITLTSLTSFIEFNQDEGTDQDGLPIAEADHDPNLGSINSFYQELRLGNGAATPARWVLGVNYEHSNVDQQIFTNYADASSAALLGIQSNTYSADQKDLNYAGFGDLEYDVLPTLTLKGGARYTNTRDQAKSCNADFSGLPNNAGPFFYNVLLGGAYGPYPKGACFVINNQDTTINGVAPGAPGEYADDLHQHNISWRGGADWKPTHDTLLYANVAKGYKAGSFPTATGSVFTSYLPVTQESVLSYEAGFKSSLFERKIEVTGAIFYYDYKDKQLRAKTIAEPFGILDVLQNVPKSSIKGAEMQVDARPFQGLTLSAALTYTDGRIDEFSGINGAGIPGNFAGSAMPFTPRYVGNLNADYSFPLASVTGFVGGGWTYHTSTVAIVGGAENPPGITPANRCAYCIGSYGTVDLRGGANLTDNLRVWLYGKNVLNRYYWTNVYSTTDTVERMSGMPATYGIAASYKF